MPHIHIQHPYPAHRACPLSISTSSVLLLVLQRFQVVTVTDFVFITIGCLHVTSRHCVVMATIADGDQEVIFYKGSTITSSQNASGLHHLLLFKSIKPRNHKEILSSTKSCYSHRGNCKKLTKKRQQKRLANLVCAVTTSSKVK